MPQSVEKILMAALQLVGVPMTIVVEPKRGEVFISYTKPGAARASEFIADGLTSGLFKVIAFEEKAQ